MTICNQILRILVCFENILRSIEGRFLISTLVGYDTLVVKPEVVHKVEVRTRANKSTFGTLRLCFPKVLK